MTLNQEKHTYSRRLGSFASATFLSRILGYVRDAMVASYFGGGMLTDAFYAAFKVPNLFRRFLGEGALTAAFVPVFTVVSHKEGKEQANRLFNALFWGLALVLLAIVLLGTIFAPQVARAVAWGFADEPEKLALTADLIRLTFPFLIVVALAALVTSVLNACGRFFIPAVAPSGLSIAEIAFVIFLASRTTSPIHGLAIAAVVGGAIHFAWQIPGLYKEGFRFQFMKPFSHPEVRTVILLMVPKIIGLCADQLNSFVDQLCASFLREGSITALYNSNRVMQLPLALFGVAVSSVALPSLSRAAADKNTAEFKDMLGFSLRIANFVLIPSFIGLAVLGYPIVQLLFERGRFLPEHSYLTVVALLPYALGLPAYSAVKILATGFYAQQNTKTPVNVALWAVGLHIATNIFFVAATDLGVAGLALSTAISGWFQAIVLFVLLKRQIGNLGGRDITKSALWGCVAGLLMGIICYGLAFWILVGQPLFVRVFVSLGTGVVFYFGLSKLLKIKEYDFFIGALLRRKIEA
jgi:putative peptidoglycan lipid II flippase